MNYDIKIKGLKKDIEKLEQDYETSKVFTAKFLEVCKNHGIKNVGINDQDETVVSSVWSSAPYSVFSKEKSKDSNWPAIWEAARKAGIHGGCGNSDQAQITYEASQLLIDGIYEFKSGKWIRK